MLLVGLDVDLEVEEEENEEEEEEEEEEDFVFFREGGVNVDSGNKTDARY